MDLLEYAALHLLGRFVGEGDGEYVAIGHRILDDIAYILVG